MMLLRKTAVALVVLGSVLLLAYYSLDQNSNLMQFSGVTMGTRYTIKLVPVDAHDLSGHKNKVDELLYRFERQMSTYQKHSELMQFNAFAVGEWFPASESLLQLFEESIQISKLTGGAFDITVGPLVRLWGFGPDPRQENPPPQARIQALLARVDYQSLELGFKNRAIKKHKDVEVDLSAIAKGAGVDAVAELLESMGVKNYMVEIGGEVRVAGYRVDQQPWRIGIEAPLVGERSVQTVVHLHQGALASSGDYRNFFESDGIRYSHTIDPRQGYPIRHNLAAVTVIRPVASRADALATALMVLGLEQGYDLALRESIPAYFIFKTGTGFEVKMTPQFSAYLTQPLTS